MILFLISWARFCLQLAVFGLIWRGLTLLEYRLRHGKRVRKTANSVAIWDAAQSDDTGLSVMTCTDIVGGDRLDWCNRCGSVKASRRPHGWRAIRNPPMPVVVTEQPGGAVLIERGAP